MIRNLKILMLAAMAVAAFGALNAVGAQAAQFHCTPAAGQTGCNLTLEPDGAVPSKTAHHVFEITNKLGESTVVTCAKITGSVTLAKTAEDVTIPAVYPKLISESPVIFNCTWNGSNAEVFMNGCKYTLNANGAASIVGPSCLGIQVKIPTCTATINEQPAEGTVGYHNLGTPPANRTVTFELKTSLTVAVASLSGSNCGVKQEGPYVGHLTTANTIVKAEEDPGTKEVDGWWE